MRDIKFMLGMKTNCYLKTTFFLIMTMFTITLPAQSLNDTSITGFEHFLSFFRTFQLPDTMVNLSAMTPWTEVVEDTVFKKDMEKWVNPVPFFTQSPMFKIRKELCWYVLVKNVCTVANIEMCYIDMIGYSLTGEKKDRIFLKVMDDHGGLGPELDEERLSQGLVLMNKDSIIHKWFDNVPIAGDATQMTMYYFDSFGNIIAHSPQPMKH